MDEKILLFRLCKKQRELYLKIKPVFKIINRKSYDYVKFISDIDINNDDMHYLIYNISIITHVDPYDIKRPYVMLPINFKHSVEKDMLHININKLLHMLIKAKILIYNK